MIFFGGTAPARTFLTQGRLSEDIDLYSSNRHSLCREIHQQYSDVPSSKLLAPTFDGFVTMKALAWFDRHSARDLFDLEGLSHKGKVTQGARELIEQLKGFRLSREMMMGRVVGLWHEELAHQTKLEKTEDECFERHC